MQQPAPYWRSPQPPAHPANGPRLLSQPSGLLPPGPPFSAVEARTARLSVGTTPTQVALSMAKLGVPASAALVEAWESGTRTPSEAELFALADALWCPVPALMALHPLTLREHRLSRQLTPARLAERIGMEVGRYTTAEADHRWSGDEQQTRALGGALGLGTRPEEVLEVLGRGAELVGLLRQAVEGRWSSQVEPVAALALVEPARVAYALQVLNAQYPRFAERHMGQVAAGRMGAGRAQPDSAERARWLLSLPDSFRALVESRR